MLRSTLIAALLAGLALATTPARAQNVAWSVSVGTGGAFGAYVGVPGPVVAVPPVAVYPGAPVYSPTVVVSAPRVYAPAPVYPAYAYPVPRVAYPGPTVWVGPRVRAYPVVLPVYGGRGHWRGHGHRH